MSYALVCPAMVPVYSGADEIVNGKAAPWIENGRKLRSEISMCRFIRPATSSGYYRQAQTGFSAVSCLLSTNNYFFREPLFYANVPCSPEVS